MRTVPRPRLPAAVLGMIGVWITIIGFGLLALDAALGVIAIPAGVLLSIAGMPSPRDRAP